MNAFGGFIQIGSSETAEIFFSVANDFFETAFQEVRMKKSEGFACWNGSSSRVDAVSSSDTIHESSCKRYLLTGYFRLDYRDELGDKLGIRYADLAETHDSFLALQAFEKWKFDVIYHLEGDWAIVIYDKKNSELFLLRDPIGAAAIFYFQQGNQLFFSDNPRFFLALGIDFTIDPEQFFKLGLASGKLDDGKTILQGVCTLKRGEAVAFNGHIRILKQLPILKAGRKLSFKFDEDYVARFKSTYAAAVRTRIGKGNTGLFLSAGLDSSMLCYFAARELLVLQKKLKTYTSFPKFIDLFPEEKQHRIREDIAARNFVAGFSNVEACFMDFRDADIAQVLKSNQSDQLAKPLIKPNTFWIDGISGKAAEDGVQTMFVAKMSNYTVSWDAPMIGLFYLNQLHFFQLFQFMKDLGQCNPVKWMKVIKHELMLPCKRELQLFFKRLHFRVRGFRSISGICKMDFFDTRSYKKWDFKKQFVPGYVSGKNPKKLREMIFSSSIDQVGIFNSIDRIRFGMRLVDPSADRRLVSLSFDLPERLFFQKGKRKFLYRSVMTGLLDEEIINKRVPYPQAYDIGLRLLERSGIKEMMNRLQQHPEAGTLFNAKAAINDIKSMKRWGFQTEGLRKAGTILRLLSLFQLLEQFHFPEKMNKFEDRIEQ